ncbi:MAG: hypothetical protein K0S14_25 [Thermomicrobiales bacterium]|jgi:hypothetical protein|nr:hypothetical protein [Thermomicrobiales bacterium]
MIEKLIPVDLPPGFFHNGTKYEAKGRWYDGNLVRWHNGVLQPVGGWTRFLTNGNQMGALSGKANAIATYEPPSGIGWVVVGTTTGLYAMEAQAGVTTWSNITPSGWVSGSKRWQLDVFGSQLVAFSWGDWDIAIWDGVLTNPAVAVTGSPTQILGGMVVTPERFIFTLGADNNQQKVAWPDQETSTVWTPAATNQAGDIELQTQGELITGRRVRGQTLLWTGHDLWSATYIGGQFVYSFRQEGDACGLQSAQAVAIADSRAFWMGRNGFFTYDGWVRPLDCDVHDKVFGEISSSKASEVSAWANTDFNEIWWFYGTTALASNDRYVKYNYRTNVWDYGTLGRDAVYHSASLNYPLAVDSAGLVWRHENGSDRGSEVPYVESGPYEIEGGDRVMRIQRIVPDEKTLGHTTMSIYTAFDPTTAETENGPYTLTQPTDVRLTARQIRVKITESGTGAGDPWRVGKPKLGVIPLGRR